MDYGHGAAPLKFLVSGFSQPFNSQYTAGDLRLFQQRQGLIAVYALGRDGLHILDAGRGNVSYPVKAAKEDGRQGLPRMNTGSRNGSRLPTGALGAHLDSGLGRNLATTVAVLHRKPFVLAIFVLTQCGLTLQRGLVPGGVDKLYIVPVRRSYRGRTRFRRAFYTGG